MGWTWTTTVAVLALVVALFNTWLTFRKPLRDRQAERRAELRRLLDTASDTTRTIRGQIDTGDLLERRSEDVANLGRQLEGVARQLTDYTLRSVIPPLNGSMKHLATSADSAREVQDRINRLTGDTKDKVMVGSVSHNEDQIALERQFLASRTVTSVEWLGTVNRLIEQTLARLDHLDRRFG